MRYQEYKPPRELALWVKLFWVFENRLSTPEPETIVADGFPEMIIHFRSPFAESDEAGQFLPQAAAVACGQLTKPLVLHSSQNAGMIGIRFQPGGMAAFLKSSMHCLTDTRVPAEDLFTGVDRLIEEVSDAPDDAGRTAACSRFLLRSIDAGCDDLNVRRAVDCIQKTRGSVSIDSLATLAGRSRRSIELSFQKQIGISPKMYSRITRFRHVYDALSDENSAGSQIRIALESGFFDQSHMIRDFRRFTGDSPTSFLARQSSFTQTVN